MTLSTYRLITILFTTLFVTVLLGSSPSANEQLQSLNDRYRFSIDNHGYLKELLPLLAKHPKNVDIHLAYISTLAEMGFAQSGLFQYQKRYDHKKNKVNTYLWIKARLSTLGWDQKDIKQKKSLEIRLQKLSRSKKLKPYATYDLALMNKSPAKRLKLAKKLIKLHLSDRAQSVPLNSHESVPLNSHESVPPMT